MHVPMNPRPENGHCFQMASPSRKEISPPRIVQPAAAEAAVAGGGPAARFAGLRSPPPLFFHFTRVSPLPSRLKRRRSLSWDQSPMYPPRPLLA